MQTIKLHEATKQFKLSNKLAMFFLEKKEVPVKSHSSTITMEQLELLREFSENQKKYSEIIAEFKKVEKENKQKKVRSSEKKTKPEPKMPEEKVSAESKPKADKPVQPVERVEKKDKPDRIEKPVTSEPKIEKIKPVEPAKEVKKPVKKEKVKVPQVRKIAAKKILRQRPVEKKESKKREVRVVKKPAPRIVEKKNVKFDLPELIQISNFITLKELSAKMNLKLKYIEERLKEQKKEYLSSQIMDISDIEFICRAFNVELDIVPYEDYVHINHIEKHHAKLVSRPPVVTVMGHVDHGKTTLLDRLRNSRIADREKGGITQKIGAYRLSTNGDEIIFIDTPGHEAFTNIRARGAKVTDIVILMVAADDGVKPQTIEAINHALSAEVPIIVAINKIDKEGADTNRVKQELTKHNILVEDWGGDVVSVDISAKQNQNLDALLEMIVLVSEMQELKTHKDIPARGTILESRLDPKLGPVATVLIQEGLVRRGDFFICGNSVGKIKSIFDDWGKVLKEADAVIPVEIMGFEEVPEAGQRFQVVDEIDKARKVIDMRKITEKEAKTEGSLADKKLSLQNLFEKFEQNKTKVFPIIVKTDNFSSAEVIEKILLKQNQEKLRINIIHKGVGHITEGDILLASTGSALIVGFNVKVSPKILALAKREKIEIKLFNVIYHLIEEIEKAIKGEIEPEYVENAIGKVEILQKFKISKIGNIAGCVVKEGKITNKSKIKVLRDNDLVFEGEIETLKRIKDEVAEVNAGTECGIKIKNFNDIEVGDILEIYELKIKQ